MPSTTKSVILATAAALLFHLPSTTASIWFVNNCAASVYVDAVQGGGGSSTTSVVPSGYEEELPFPSAVGNYDPTQEYSIKLNFDDSADNVLQLEYSLGSDNLVWYDLSAQDGDPFADSVRGFSVSPQSGSCQGEWCAAGDDSCEFIGRNAAGPMQACDPSTDVYFYVC